MSEQAGQPQSFSRSPLLPRLVAPAILLLAGLLVPAPALAADAASAERLCSGGSGEGAARPGEAALLRAARMSEARLPVLRDAPETPLGTVIAEPLPAPGDAPATPAAIAAYCAAAGEAMRLASGGSQAQAVIYLLGAFRAARRAGDAALAELAAYRLALVGIGGPTVAGGRGASAPRRAAEPPKPAAGPASGDGTCDRLERMEPGRMVERDLSELALACAAGSALDDGRSRLAALANLRLAKVYLAAADQPDRDGAALRQSARDTALAALSPAAAMPDPAERGETLARLARIAIALGAADDPAVISAIAAIRHSASEAPDTDGIAEAVEARRALGRGDKAAARRSIEAAILAESRRALPTRLPAYYLQLAEADAGNALRHVETAYAALDAVRPLLPRLDPLTDESTFSLAMRDVFEAAADAELGAATGDGAANRIARAQEIVEAYRQAELQSAFGSGCVPPRQPLRLAQLRPGEIILYPLLLPDRVELLYVARGTDPSAAPQFRRLPPRSDANRASVTRLVEQVVVSLGSGAPRDGWQPAARRLYDLLIAPIADRLRAEAVLAIVPDGALRALPFAALPAPDGRFLVEQTRLSLIPALDYSEPEGARARRGLRVVAASLDKGMDLPAGRFPALSGTAREAAVALRYASVGAALPDFTRADLVQALDAGRTDVLHLATHAAFNGRSDRAFIVANGETIRLGELREIVGRSRTRGTPLDLIVLSACETAVGDDEVSMGLSGAVVEAGARSVIGSLWEVSDLGTTRLMEEFYRRYGSGETRSAALREAQLALLRSGGDEASPSVWAAFSLLGAWR